MGWLGWTLTILGLISGILSVCAIVGLFVPRDHAASRELSLNLPPAEVFSLLRNLNGWPSWWKLVSQVDMLPDRDGRPAYHLTYTNGNRFDLVVAEDSSPQKFITRIDDVNNMFHGSWTYELSQTADGCRVRLTEHGSIPNPLVRFMARMMMDNSQYISWHLSAVANHFGESPRISE